MSQLPAEFSLGKRTARESSHKDETDTTAHYLNQQEDGDIIMEDDSQ